MGSEYEVRLHGIVSARALEALCVEHEMQAETVLRGVMQDQAALLGLLARISDFGLDLVDVRQVQHRDQPPPRDL
jgi:hypothetical protein